MRTGEEVTIVFVEQIAVAHLELVHNALAALLTRLDNLDLTRALDDEDRLKMVLVPNQRR